MNGLDRFWRPVGLPALLGVEFFYDDVDLAELRLMSSLSLMSFRYNMLVEILVAHVADLAIRVINLRSGNFNVIVLGMQDTLRF